MYMYIFMCKVPRKKSTQENKNGVIFDFLKNGTKLLRYDIFQTISVLQ